MNRPIFRVALAGWGLAGRYFHAPFIATTPGLELVAAATSQQPEPALFPGVRVAPSFEELIALPDIDVVVIATPNRLHAPHARAALEAGKHVVVEKPVAATSAEWVGLVALAAQRQRLLVPFHNRRWDGDYLTVRALLAEGRLGPVHFFASVWPRYRPKEALRAGWKAEPDPTSGVLYDLGAHLVDQTLLIFGEPERVSARVAHMRPDSVNDDWLRLTLEFPPTAHNPVPVTALLEVDSLNAAPVPRFHVRGRRATYEKHGLDPQEAALRQGAMPGASGWGAEPEQAWGTLYGPDSASEKAPTVPGDYGAFYRALYVSLSAGAPPPVEASAATLQLRILESARLTVPRSPHPDPSP